MFIFNEQTFVISRSMRTTLSMFAPPPILNGLLSDLLVKKLESLTDLREKHLHIRYTCNIQLSNNEFFYVPLPQQGLNDFMR